MSDQLKSPYNSKETEGRIYDLWEKSGYFNPDNLPDRHQKPFTIVLPPPNVTGVLHLGHAYESSLQDAVIRYQRLQGKKTLWIPGTDSAAIATQARVEKNIKKDENKTRHDLGRDELVKRITEFAKNSEHTILNQIKRLGSSLDWSRYAYTLDEKRNKAVATAFKRMYDLGLIYRSNRIVNWDPKGQTTISDDEIVYEEKSTTLYTFKYAEDFPIAISTTRPETKVGDVAVAVHPDDERYQSYIGQEYDLNFCDVSIHIKIIADEAVEKDFGTGALGVTPAHSHIDWDIADRHDLPRPQVINEYAQMSVSGPLANKKVAEAREMVVWWLKENNLLTKEETISHNVATSERTGAIIEPLPKLQWWVNVSQEFVLDHSEIPGLDSGQKTTLKEIMQKSVESGAINMPQENFQKIYFHWIKNLRDWCISRQIWFGHRIPIWYKDDQIYCDTEAPTDNGWQQEEDVLDTWFSSALWTFSTLGWPDQTKDLNLYHPTSFMSPAYEILPLWVSRMILMSGFHLGQVPFKTVLIHGLVRDKTGRKFSKSLNNGIDPIEMIEKYGADALRIGLLAGTTVGNDVKFDEDKIKGYKHFANKLWNITRFISDNTASVTLDNNFNNFSDEDQQLLTDQDNLITDITADLDHYRFHLGAEKIYHYLWHELADKIIEDSKLIFTGDSEPAKISRGQFLLHTLKKFLIVLHPFMPFITEELWGIMKFGDKSPLIIATWPTNGH